MSSLIRAPLPKLTELIIAALHSPDSDEMLAKAWCRSGDKALWLSRSSWSLAAIARTRQQMLQQENICVWVPDYFCNIALVHMRAAGVSLVFYPITVDLTPDFDKCMKLAGKYQPDIVLLVHYFGQPTRTEQIAQFCRNKNVWLVEDAAHVLRPIHGVGEAGDFVLYSPHKFLPIPDGAVLVVRQNGPARIGDEVDAVNLIRKMCATISEPRRKCDEQVVYWLATRILLLLGVRHTSSSFGFNSDLAQASNPKPWEEPPRLAMSGMAKRLLSLSYSILDDVAYLREKNAEEWRNVLSEETAASCYQSILKSTAPYLAAFNCYDMPQAQDCFQKLQRIGVPVRTWPDLPPEVTSAKDEHSIAVSLRNTRVYLPTHQSLNQKQILSCKIKLCNA